AFSVIERFKASDIIIAFDKVRPFRGSKNALAEWTHLVYFRHSLPERQVILREVLAQNPEFAFKLGSFSDLVETLGSVAEAKAAVDADLVNHHHFSRYFPLSYLMSEEKDVDGILRIFNLYPLVEGDVREMGRFFRSDAFKNLSSFDRG